MSKGCLSLGFFVQYIQKIMHAQELLFASASRELLAATCRMPALEYCKPQERLCANIVKTRNPEKVKKRPLRSARHVRNWLPL